ncbi:MAG: SH3 domain-containing protein [Synergistaceae bacterium]|nr:SH3 domain-containing protein [Synergistaceae bacterium]
MDKRSTKERLDELDELLRGGYLTPSESRAARAHILRESGIDIEGAEDVEATQGGSRGCGCFLAVVFLTLALVLGAAFAIPEWPKSLGGVYISAAREWVMNQCETLWKKLWGGDASDEPISEHPQAPQAPISADVTRDAVVLPPSSPSSPEASSADSSVEPSSTEPSFTEHSSLPAIDSRTLALPDAPSVGSGRPEPRVTVVEIPAPLVEIPSPPSEEPDEPQTQPLRRGSISSKSARIRSRPDTSTNNNVVKTGRKGDRFFILKEAIGSNGSKWYNIRYESGGQEGWISASLVTLER